MNHSDHNGSTALIWAAFGGHEKSVQLLLADPRVDVNHSDHKGTTALIGAAFVGHEKSVQLLLEDSRVDVNSISTPLYAAVTGDHVGVVSKLLDHPNINLDILDESLDVAR